MASHILKNAAAVVGIGETPFARRSGVPVKAMVISAIESALADAGLTTRDVDGFVTDGAVMPNSVPHDEVAATLGIAPYFSATSSYWGSGIASAHLMAAQAIATGQAKVVVSYFGVDWGSRAGAAYQAVGDPGDPKEVFEKPFGYFGQPFYFGAIAQRYAYEYGVDLPTALSAVAIQQRKHALASGTAQMNKELSEQQYLEAAYVAEPLRIPDCCLLTDGAAATVMVAADRAADTKNVPVYIEGAAMVAGPQSMAGFFSQNTDYLSWPSAAPAVKAALDMAECRLQDMRFAELYDCFTITMLMQIESIGWCAPGEAAEFIDGGKRISLDGEIPMNTHGGLLSHSYLLGMSHITEAVRQIRGQAGGNQVAEADRGLIGLLAGPHYGALVLGR